METRNFIIYCSIISKGDWDETYRLLRRGLNFVSENEVDEVCNAMTCRALTILDEEYPPLLKEIFKPPFVLFYEGDISLIKNLSRNLGVVGSRDYDESKAQLARSIIRSLPDDVTIVSGLARGIDAIAHEAAISCKKKTIAVLGSGIDVCYPTENFYLFHKIRREHLLLSEYPMGISPDPTNFPKRNRIVVGLSKALFIPQAKKVKSGTMISAALAMIAGKDIYCLPSEDYNESGCNYLVKMGAYLVENAEDITVHFDVKNYYGT